MRDFIGWTEDRFLDSPAEVVDVLRAVFIEAHPHLKIEPEDRAREKEPEEAYDLKKVVEEDGTVSKRREIAPGEKELFGLFGPPRARTPEGSE